MRIAYVSDAIHLRPTIHLFVGLSILIYGFSASSNEATLCIEGLSGSVFYVSPLGNDSWSGLLAEPNADGTDGPFATLARARDAMWSDPEIDTTYVREGTYHPDSTVLLTSQDSGVSFVAYAGESPVISGGQAGLGTIIKLDNADGVNLLGLTFSDATKDTHLDGFALELRNVDGAMIGHNTFLNVGTAIDMNWSNNNFIVGNEMGHMAYSGVYLSNGNDNLFLGNYMHDLGEVFTHSAAGVNIRNNSSDNRIAYNLIENSSTYGVSMKSNEQVGNIVEYNRIINIGTGARDVGAIEMLGRSGNDTQAIIRYNYIEGAGQYSQDSFVSGIYLDDLSSGVTIHGNFIKDISLSGFHLHGGRDISITNNIVILGDEPVLRSDGSIWNNQLFVWEQVDGVRPRLMENIEWSGNILSAPDGLTPDGDYWKRSGSLAGEPTVGDNLLHNVNAYDGPADGTAEDGSIFANPLFVDPANGDYTLQASSPALDLGFEPLPFAQMGLAGFEVLDLAVQSEILGR